MDTVYDSMFNNNGDMAIECKASYEDFLFEKKQLGLRKQAQQVVYDQGYTRWVTLFNYGHS